MIIVENNYDSKKILWKLSSSLHFKEFQLKLEGKE